MDADAHLDRESPERLHRLTFGLGFETFETLDAVGILEKGDVGAVIAIEFTHRITLHRQDRTGGGLYGDVIPSQLAFHHVGQVGDGPVARGADPGSAPADFLRLKRADGPTQCQGGAE